MEKYVSVIGGSHVTVSGMSFLRQSENENPGVVALKLDGEARNLSEKLALSGVNVKLITALGRDVFAEGLKADFDRLGIDYSNSLTLDAPTSAVIELSDDIGELKKEICDYRILRNMDMEFFSSRLDVLNNSQACYVDAKYDFEKLEFLCHNVTCPIFADTVSVKSSLKLKSLLKYVYTLKSNKAELEHLIGYSLVDENNFRAATERLLNAGVKNVFVTCGKDGVWYNNGKEFGHVDADSAIVVNRSGVGSVFNAMLIKGYLEGLSIREIAQMGVKATAEFISKENVTYL
ncbi:MAG: bifunctional hydroxymethylpyrimidine kinase/phosphomethylpyrimidine kinase [Clostridia bacterium]|nr:bifunctional hydroxymethylpyrimidine kinase/phosphomethylpyrimidine kinase [Clostridia bacterium]